MTSWSPDLGHSGTGVVPCEMRLRVRHWGLCYRQSAVSLTSQPPRPGSWRYADDMRWWTPQLVRNVLVMCEPNSGPPCEVSELGIPKVAKVSRSVWVRPIAPSLEVVTTGQFKNLSTKTLPPRCGKNPHRCAGTGRGVPRV